MGHLYDEFKKIIEEKIREDQFRSYKSFEEKGEEKHPWLKSVCSFLNSYGGKLYLGLKEEQHLPSKIIPTMKVDRDVLSRYITTYIDPSISGELFEIQEENISENGSEGRIFIINIKTSQIRPHSYKGRFYWRRDDEDIYMNIGQIERKIIEARAEKLIFEELWHNANLARKFVEATQPCYTERDFGRYTVFAFTKLQTIAWGYLWEHGLIAMIGENFEELRGIYYETQSINEIIDLLRSDYRGMYSEEEKGGSCDAVRKLSSKAAILGTKIDKFLVKKSERPI